MDPVFRPTRPRKEVGQPLAPASIVSTPQPEADQMAAGFFSGVQKQQAIAAETAAKAAADQAEATTKQANYELDKQAALENRETITNPTTGRREFVMPEADWQKQQQVKAAETAAKEWQRQQNDALELRYRKEGRQFFTDSSGAIRPVQDDAEFATNQAEQQKAERTKARRERTAQELATQEQLYTIDREARPILPKEEREKLTDVAANAAEDALYRALSDKNLAPEAKTRLQAISTALAAKGNRLALEDVPEDLRPVIAKAAPDSWKAAGSTFDQLRADDENRQWRTQRESEIEALRLKNIDPKAWREKYQPDLPTARKSYETRATALADRQRRRYEEDERLAKQWDVVTAENEAMRAAGGTQEDFVPMTVNGEQTLVHKKLAPRIAGLTRATEGRRAITAEEDAAIEGERTALTAEHGTLQQRQQEEAAAKEREFSSYLDKLDREPDLAPVASQYRAVEADYRARLADIEADFSLSPQERQTAMLALHEDRKAGYAEAGAALETANQSRRKRAEGMAKLVELADNQVDGTELYDYDPATREVREKQPGIAGKLFARQRDQIAAIAAESGMTVTEAARTVRDIEDTRRTWQPREYTRILSDGRIAVNPTLAFDNEGYRAAIEASTAKPEAKAAAIEAQVGLQDALAPRIVAGLRKLGNFREFEEAQAALPREQRPRTEGEVIARYYETRGKTRAAADTAALILRQGGNDIASQFFGMGAAIGLHPWMPQGWRERSRAVIEDLADQQDGALTGASADMAASLEAAGVPALVQDLGRAGVSMAPALASGAIGVAGKGATAALMVNGSRLGNVGRVLLGSMARTPNGVTMRAITPAMASQMATQAGLGGAGAGAFMQTFGSTYPEAVAAYESAGLDFDTAASEALMPSIGAATFTAAITMAFGKSGAERVLRGKTPTEVTIGDLIETVAGAQGKRYREVLRSPEFRKMAGQMMGDMAGDVGKEAVEEGTDQLISGLIRLGTYETDDTRTVGDVMGEALQAALIGGALGGAGNVMGQTRDAAGRVVDRVKAKRQAEAPASPEPVNSDQGTVISEDADTTPEEGMGQESRVTGEDAGATSESVPTPTPESISPSGEVSTTTPQGAEPAPLPTNRRPERQALAVAEIEQAAAAGDPDFRRAQAMQRVAMGEAEALSATEMAEIGLERSDTGQIRPRRLSKMEQEAGPVAPMAAMEGDQVVLTTEGLDWLGGKFPRTRALVAMDEPQARAYFRERAMGQESRVTGEDAGAQETTQEDAPTEDAPVDPITEELTAAGFDPAEPIIRPRMMPAPADLDAEQERALQLATHLEDAYGLDASRARAVATAHVTKFGVTDPEWMMQAMRDMEPDLINRGIIGKGAAKPVAERVALQATREGEMGGRGEGEKETSPKTLEGDLLLRGARFKDAAGKLYEVWKNRQGVVEAHPVIDGKAIVNNSSGEKWAITPESIARNPEYRTDITPVKETTPFTAPAKPAPVAKTTAEIVEAAITNNAKAFSGLGDVPIVRHASAPSSEFEGAMAWADPETGTIHIVPDEVAKQLGTRATAISAVIEEEYWHLATTQALAAKFGGNMAEARAHLAKIWREFKSRYTEAAKDFEKAYGGFRNDENAGWELSRAVMQLRHSGRSTEETYTKEQRAEMAALAKHFGDRGGFPLIRTIRTLIDALLEWVAGQENVSAKLRELADAAAALAKDGAVFFETGADRPRVGQIWENSVTRKRFLIVGIDEGTVMGRLEGASERTRPMKIGADTSDFGKVYRLVPQALKRAATQRRRRDYDRPFTPLLNFLRENPIAPFDHLKHARLLAKRKSTRLTSEEAKWMENASDYDGRIVISHHPRFLQPFLSGIYDTRTDQTPNQRAREAEADGVLKVDGATASDLFGAIEAEIRNLEAWESSTRQAAGANQWEQRETVAKMEAQDAAVNWWTYLTEAIIIPDFEAHAMEALDPDSGAPTGKTGAGKELRSLLPRRGGDLAMGDNVTVDGTELTVAAIDDAGVRTLSNGITPSRFYEDVITLEPQQAVYFSKHVDAEGRKVDIEARRAQIAAEDGQAMPDYEGIVEAGPEVFAPSPRLPLSESPRAPRPRFEAEQFDLLADVDPAANDAQARREAEIRRMEMRALQSRRLVADDLTDQPDLGLEGGSESGQGMLFAARSRDPNQRAFDFGTSGSLAGNPNQMAFDFTEQTPAPATAPDPVLAAPLTQAELIEIAPTPDAPVTGDPREPESRRALRDFGEKIGGARKDLATKATAPKRPRSEASGEPWRKGWIVTEIVAGQDAGRWSLMKEEKRSSIWSSFRSRDEPTFATESEAEAALPARIVIEKHSVREERDVEGNTLVGRWAIYRQVSDRKRAPVKKGFASQEEGIAYMLANPVEILNTKINYGEEILALREGQQIRRTGPERRPGGRDADQRMFMDAFGFRGVEFGNWVTTEEGQEVLNHAYDGLYDLAEMLRIPTRAISLNGDLALASGARGHGLSGARAHYETDRVVINLTKMKGAGSLAHEWMHALDHYFAREEGRAKSQWKILEDGTRMLPPQSDDRTFVTSGDLSYGSKLRPEIAAAWKRLREVMFRRRERSAVDSEAAQRWADKQRDSMVENITQIRANMARDRQYGSRKGAATAAQLARWDAAVDSLADGTAGPLDWKQGRAEAAAPEPVRRGRQLSLKGYRWTNDAFETLSEIHKEVTNRSGFAGENSTLDYAVSYYKDYLRRLAKLEEAVQQGGTEEKMLPTRYYREAIEGDLGRASNYWQTPWEMAARAFSSYVEDTAREQGMESGFLSTGSTEVDNAFYRMFYGFAPYPEGAERSVINETFRELFGQMQTRETDTGTALFAARPRRDPNQRAFDFGTSGSFAGDRNQMGFDFETPARDNTNRINTDDLPQRPDVERDRPAGAGNGGRQGGVSPQRPADRPDGGSLAGGRKTPGTAAPSNLPADDLFAALGGELSDPSLRSETPANSRRPAGDTDAGRSGGTDDRGVAPETRGESEPAIGLVQPGPAPAEVASSSALGEIDDVLRTAPALKREQAGDVAFLEQRFAKAQGALLTNGTGTGKTFSGLGYVARLLEQGKKHILIAAPSDKVGSDWVSTAQQFFNIPDATQLADTRDNGAGNRVVVTTYANLGQNPALAQRPWDAIVTDEAHYLSQNQAGEVTLPLQAVRALTMHERGARRYAEMLRPDLAGIVAAIRGIDYKQRTRQQQAQLDEAESELSTITDVRRQRIAAVAKEDKPKVLMLSATPFAYHFSLDYADGYLYDLPADTRSGGYNQPSPRDAFYISRLGYRMRYNKLTVPENATAVGILERRLAEEFMREGAMAGRSLEVDQDYGRQFVLAESEIGFKIDEIFKAISDSNNGLSGLRDRMGLGNYLERRYLFEALKARESVERIRQHLALGRKVVVFHDYKQGGATNPLPDTLSGEFPMMEGGEMRMVSVQSQLDRLKALVPHYMATRAELSGLRAPIGLYGAEFGAQVGIFNGSVPAKQRRGLVDRFNDPNSGLDILLVQRASGKEGISLHDRAGDKQRVIVDLGFPSRPTDAIQCEGRIYRLGVQSPAIFEYLTTGTDAERTTFAQTIAKRSSTAENLAMGQRARSLLQAFADGYNDASAATPSLTQGAGGKARDAARNNPNPFKDAVALFYSNGKKTKQNKAAEGVDYFATPEPLGFKMVEWAGIREGEKVLEPSAGHGAIARFFPDTTNRHAVEPSFELVSRIMLNATDTQVHQQSFEDYAIVNKFDAIVMNPPFGTAGKTAMDHIAKAAKHLRNGGRIVALIPDGSSMAKRLEDWLASEDADGIYQTAEYSVPTVAFSRAGTNVKTRVVILDKTDNPDGLATSGRGRDFSGETLEEFFTEIENTNGPARAEVLQPDPASDFTETAEIPAEAPATPGVPSISQWTRGTVLPASGGPTNEGPANPAKFAAAEGFHAKKQVPTYVATINVRLDRPDYEAALATAKKHGGYYSNFRGAGAVPGFQFPTAEQRDAFLGETMPPPDPQTALFAARPRQTAPVEPGFYSRLAETIAEKVPNRATPQQILATIAPDRGSGVKEEEIKWSGLRQAVERLASENGGSVPKQALLDYLAADGVVRLEEVRMQDSSSMSRDLNEEYRAGAISQEEYSQRYTELIDGVPDPLFAQYQLPGGENYREVVLALPNSDPYYVSPSPAVIAKYQAEWDAIASQAVLGEPLDPEISEALDQLLYRMIEDTVRAMPQNYTSSHFPNVPNYVAHMRLNERSDAAGKPGLFIEEIQSDRHQAGREKGYATPRWTQEEEARVRELEMPREYPGLSIAEQNEYVALMEKKAISGTPDAPFRKDWPLQLFKRALRDAVASGKEWIGWTTGETQAERYNLQNHVRRIRWTGYNDRGATKQVTIEPLRGNDIELPITADGVVIPNLGTQFDGKRIDEIIGKEIAAKIIAERDGDLSGRGLKVGGEGMKGFYDNILPKEIAKYVKQWGGQVEKDEIKTAYWSKYDTTTKSLASGETALIWRVPITPEMRVGVEAGQPLFAPTVRASAPSPSLPLSPSPTPRAPRAPGETLFDAAINTVTSAMAATDTVEALKTRIADTYAAPFAKPIRKAVDFLLSQAVPLQRLDAETNAMMREMAVKQAFAQEEAMDVIRSLSRKPKFSDLAWPAKYANDKGMKKRLFLAMQGKVAMDSLPPEVQQIGADLRKRLNDTALEAVRQGRMHPDTFRDLRDSYMPHYYYDNEKAAAGSLFARMKLGLGDIMAQRSTMWRIEDTKAKDPFTGEEGALVTWDEKGKKVRFRGKEHRDAFYRDFLAERIAEAIKTRGKVAAFSPETRAQIDRLTPADLNRPDKLTPELRGYYKRVEQEMKMRYRKGDPLTDEEQEKAGLITDPVYAVAKHIAGMAHDNATAEFFNGLAERPGITGEPDTSGYVQLPDNRKLGRLAGKWVREDVAEEVTQLVNAPGDLVRFYDGVLALWKTGKTVYNPGTHVRNVLGNLLFAQMAGVNPLDPRNRRHYAAAWQAIRNGGPLLEEMYQAGVLGGDFLAAELRTDLAEMLPDLDIETGDDWLMKISSTIDSLAHKTGVKKAKQFIEGAYQMEDELFKAASYLRAKSAGMTNEEAAAHTRKWFAYYDQIGTSTAIRALRRTAMPFFSFQREAIRILANAARERPVSLAFAMAAPVILSALSAAALGLDAEDYEEIRKNAMRGKGKFFARDYPLFSILLPIRSSEGRLQQFDLTNVMPFASLLGSRLESQGGKPAWQQLTLEMIASSPITGIPLEMAFNQDTFTGKPIWEENMTPGEQARAAASNVWQQMVPPLVPGGTGWNTLANAGERYTNKSLERRNAAQAVLRAVVGLDVRNASPNLYDMAETFREQNGLPSAEGGSYGTTPESRARARIWAQLVKDEPNAKAIAHELNFLRMKGKPIENDQDLQRLLFYRNPIMVIEGEENQRRFRRSLSPESAQVLRDAEEEYSKIARQSSGILRQARAIAATMRPPVPVQ